MLQPGSCQGCPFRPDASHHHLPELQIAFLPLEHNLNQHGLPECQGELCAQDIGRQ